MFESKQTIREETDEIKAFTLQSYEAFVSGFIRFREIDLKSPGKTSQSGNSVICAQSGGKTVLCSFNGLKEL